ncbi:MAG TPA: hypothetical protein VMK65_04680 [Longimicrobiales bacterium]|nr:hypothetical protein [Longimicrobiales bacterium]
MPAVTRGYVGPVFPVPGGAAPGVRISTIVVFVLVFWLLGNC